MSEPSGGPGLAYEQRRCGRTVLVVLRGSGEMLHGGLTQGESVSGAQGTSARSLRNHSHCIHGTCVRIAGQVAPSHGFIVGPGPPLRLLTALDKIGACCHSSTRSEG